MKKIISIIILILSISGIILTFKYFPAQHPEWNLKYNLNREQIKSLAKDELNKQGADIDKYEVNVYFETNANLIKYISNRYSGDSIAYFIPNYFISNYKVNALFRDDIQSISINNHREIDQKTSSKIFYEMLINSNGTLLKYEKKYPENYKIEFTDSSFAVELCKNYLKNKYSKYDFNIYDVRIINALNKNSLVFLAKGFDELHNELTAHVEVANKEVLSANIKYSFDQSLNSEFKNDKSDILEVVSLVSQIILFVILIIFMVKRIKNDEINFKFGVSAGLILGLLYSAALVFGIINQGEMPGFYVIIPFLFIFLFMGSLFIAVISGADSIARYYWNEKFHSIDAMIKKHFLVSKVRNSIKNGFFASGIILFASFMISAIFKNVLGFNRELHFPSDYNLIINILGYRLSIFYILLPAFVLSIIYAYSGPLYITSILKMKIKNNWIVILFSIIIISAMDMPFGSKPGGLYPTITFLLFSSAILVYFFYKYDLLTIIFAALFEKIIFSAIKFNYFYIDGSEYNFYYLLGFMALFFIIVLLSFIYKKEINYDELTPAIVKRITERERISKEIEAARHIQQSFLPYKLPEIPGLNIGSVCLPAFEVGGDYYDLFKISENKLAVVIGDVSGKGIKAAFYMTLAKGIIKAQSLMYNSPAEMLTKANKIFYELVEKGNFISMIYGIFDLESKCLTYANAGHNHIIVKEISKGSIGFDRTEGIALGLTEDSVFSENIKEQTICFRPGDIFVFYTDGVVEAMNKNREEFGNENFFEIINESCNNNASEIVTTIVQKVNKFIGKAQQHDDLTLLVVKIK